MRAALAQGEGEESSLSQESDPLLRGPAFGRGRPALPGPLPGLSLGSRGLCRTRVQFRAQVHMQDPRFNLELKVLCRI